jgi:LysM repeat protein
MAEQDLLNAFNDCIDRMRTGQSIDECLRQYPRFAAALRPMLEAGRQVQSLRVSPLEVAQVQERARYRFEEAIRTTTPRRRASPLYRMATLAAAILVIFLTLSSGVGVLAQSSLPSDPLYGVKLFTEQMRLSLDASLAPEFQQRRIDETQQLLHSGRAAEVIFQGELSDEEGSNWTIAGLLIQVPPNTAGAEWAHPGDTIEVRATTTTEQQLIANTITVLAAGTQPTPTPIPTHVPTVVPATARPAATQSPSPTSTAAAPTSTASPTETDTPTPTPTLTASPTASASPTLTFTASSTVCVAAAPSGWEVYHIQPGDTLSHVATRGGITLEELMAANCLIDPGFIVVGETLFVPHAAQIVPTSSSGSSTAPTTNDNSGSNSNTSGSNSGSGSSSNGNDNGDDHGGSGGGGHGSDDGGS